MTADCEDVPESQGLSHSATSASEKQNPQGDCVLPEKVCGRYVHLDVTRVSCIIVIALCAADPRWLESNTLFFQNWVIQYLWLVCGMCYGLSKSRVLQYVGRLLLYFFVGVAAIWTACRIKKINELNIGGNMWFVLFYAIFSLLLTPLKTRIARMQENPHELLDGFKEAPEDNHSRKSLSGSRERLQKGIAWICGGQAMLLMISSLVIIPLGALAVQGSVQADSDDEKMALHSVMHFCAELQACLSAVWIVYSFPYYFSDTSVVVWLLLLNMYTFKLICGYGELVFFANGFQLLLIGVAASNLGISRRHKVSTFYQRYWMVVVFMCTWCFMPGTHGWLMIVEPEDLWTRERFVLLEVLLVVGWLVAGADMVDPKIFEADDLMWLCDWASLLFLLHQAVLIVAPEASWLVFFCLMPGSWIFHRIVGFSSIAT